MGRDLASEERNLAGYPKRGMLRNRRQGLHAAIIRFYNTILIYGCQASVSHRSPGHLRKRDGRA